MDLPNLSSMAFSAFLKNPLLSNRRLLGMPFFFILVAIAKAIPLVFALAPLPVPIANVARCRRTHRSGGCIGGSQFTGARRAIQHMLVEGTRMCGRAPPATRRSSTIVAGSDQGSVLLAAARGVQAPRLHERGSVRLRRHTPPHNRAPPRTKTGHRCPACRPLTSANPLSGRASATVVWYNPM